MFSADFVLDVLDHVPDAIVDGGWGIDALVGRVTRAHDDLDLVVPMARATQSSEALRPVGFTERLDEPPARIVLSTPYDQRVDLHVVTPIRARDGAGGPGGGRFTYALHGEGTILGRTVRCLSAGHAGRDAQPVRARRAGHRRSHALGVGDGRVASASVRSRHGRRAHTSRDGGGLRRVLRGAPSLVAGGVHRPDATGRARRDGPRRDLLRLVAVPAIAADAPAGALVAGKPGTVVGLAVMGPSRDADLDAQATGEINLLYVDPLAMGLGLGHRLLEAATAWLRRARLRGPAALDAPGQLELPARSTSATAGGTTAVSAPRPSRKDRGSRCATSS